MKRKILPLFIAATLFSSFFAPAAMAKDNLFALDEQALENVFPPSPTIDASFSFLSPPELNTPFTLLPTQIGIYSAADTPASFQTLQLQVANAIPENIWMSNFLSPGSAQVAMGDTFRGLLFSLPMSFLFYVELPLLNRFFQNMNWFGNENNRLLVASGTTMVSFLTLYIVSLIDAHNMYSKLIGNQTTIPNGFATQGISVNITKF